MSIWEKLRDQFSGRDIVIVGNGPTAFRMREYIEGLPESKDVWTISDGWSFFKNSKLGWAMDNMGGPAMGIFGPEKCEQRIQSIQSAEHPIVSCAPVDGLENLIVYPLEEVVRNFRITQPYFSESINYIMAWAIMIEVKSIEFHGVDYFNARPSERASNEFWAGVAVGRGIKIQVNPFSHFLRSGPIDGINRFVPDLYGYMEKDVPIPYRVKKNGTIEFTSKESSLEDQDYGDMN